MNSVAKLLPLLFIGLVSCEPRFVSPNNARLTAEAFLGSERFDFDCNPVADAAAPIEIPSGPGSLTLSCLSLEGIARVTLVRTVFRTGPEPERTKTTLNVVLTATTASGQMVTASASTTPSGGSYNLISSAIFEEFNASSSTFRIKGRYDLSSG